MSQSGLSGIRQSYCMSLIREKAPPWMLGEYSVKCFDFNATNSPESETYTSHQTGQL